MDGHGMGLMERAMGNRTAAILIAAALLFSSGQSQAQSQAPSSGNGVSNFFGSIFSGVLPEGLTPVETALIALELGALSFGWFSLVAILGSHPRVARAYQRASRGMDVVFGLVFIAIGTVLFVGGL